MHRDGKRIHIHLTSILPLVRHAICLGGILEGLLKGFVLTLGVTKVNRLQLLLLGVQEGRKPYKQEEMSGSFIILTTFFPGLLTWRTSEKATSDREIPPATCSWLGHLQLASCHQPAAALHMVFFFFLVVVVTCGASAQSAGQECQPDRSNSWWWRVSYGGMCA